MCSPPCAPPGKGYIRRPSTTTDQAGRRGGAMVGVSPLPGYLALARYRHSTRVGPSCVFIAHVRRIGKLSRPGDGTLEPRAAPSCIKPNARAVPTRRHGLFVGPPHKTKRPGKGQTATARAGAGRQSHWPPRASANAQADAFFVRHDRPARQTLRRASGAPPGMGFAACWTADRDAALARDI